MKKDVIRSFIAIIIMGFLFIWSIIKVESSYEVGDIRLKRTLPTVQYEMFGGTNWNEVK